MNRRTFFQTSGVAVASWWLHGRGAVSTSDQIVVQEQGVQRNVEAKPEYERKLERLLIAVPSTATLSSDALVEHSFRDLLAHLPAYTRIQVLVRKDTLLRAEKILEKLQPKKKIAFLVSSQGKDALDIWAQDFGELLTIDGKEVFLLPMDVDSQVDAFQARVVNARNRIVREVLGNAGVQQADFFFQGGNLAFDRTSEGLRVLVGFNDMARTVENYEALGREISLEAAARRVSRQFGGAQVVVVGRKRQSRYFYHIDQSLVLLGGGVAVVNQIRKRVHSRKNRNREDIALHEYYREQMKALGYKTQEISNTMDDLLRYYSSTNAIPFVDKVSGRKRILFPVFPGEVRRGAYGKASLDEADLEGKGKAAYRTYVEAGYEPIPVREAVHTKWGGLHCIANVLA